MPDNTSEAATPRGEDENKIRSALRSVYHAIIDDDAREVLWHLRELGDYSWLDAMRHHFVWLMGPSDKLGEVARDRLRSSGRTWCFILGVNNSGTTLLDRILKTHPEITGLPREGQYLTAGVPRPVDLGVSRCWMEREDVFRLTEADDTGPADRCVYDWAPYLADTAGKILLEKSPPNTIRSRWLQRNFSPCRFVSVVRSPYAVAEGIRRRTGVSIAGAARHWAEANRIMLEDLDELESTCFLTYEEFCASPRSVLKRISDFLVLDAPFDDDALKSLAVHNIDDAVGGIRNFNPKSLERLSPSDIRTVERVAGPVMEMLDYERVSAGRA